MKPNFLSVFSLVLLVSLAGCKKDNFDPPGSILSGRVIYQGQPVGVRSNGVQLELWQRGYQLFTKIPVYIAQDGAFSAALFDGDYKLTRLRGNGPWIDNTDTIDVKVNGATTMDVEVLPYFTIKNESFSYNSTDTTVSATFTVTQVVANSTVELVSLYPGLTAIVDPTNTIVAGDVTFPVASLNQPFSIKMSINPNRYPDVGGTNKAAIRANLNTLLNKKYGYLRVGVKTVGIGERIFSSVQKFEIK